jgi:hypothetical protein
MLPLDGFPQRVNTYSDPENVGCYVYFPKESYGQTTALSFEDLLKRDMGDVVCEHFRIASDMLCSVG